MAIVIILSVISFFLEGFISNYLNYTISNPTIFSTIYTLITLIIMSKYFENEKKYYLVVFIFGLLYDIVYTNTFIFNAILFVTICLVARIFINLLSDTIINSTIITFSSIVLYHILSFVILQIIGFNIYNIKLLFIIITHSIIMTIIYTAIIYYLSNYLFNRFEVKNVR